LLEGVQLAPRVYSGESKPTEVTNRQIKRGDQSSDQEVFAVINFISVQTNKHKKQIKKMFLEYGEGDRSISRK